MVLRPRLFVFFCALSGIACGASPKLVLQITVDQLRGDLPARFLDRMGEGGFRYLLNEGVVFHDAHHAHANTETIVGHATLATGAHPAAHGMVGNVWYDRGEGRLSYNIEDARYPLLTEGADVDAATEIDSTQKVAGTSGRSPARILTTTFSDQLAMHTGGKAKIFGVSVKDRGAVSMAGHAGKAFWFSKQSASFVTSKFYYDAYPEWVQNWNAQKLPSHYADTSWELSQTADRYLYPDTEEQDWEVDFPGYGRTFPHTFGAETGKYFTTLLTLSPVGDELTLDFAKTLLVNENLGKDEVTDYLSVSFSSTDYVGHFFGPSSREMEDNLLRLDRSIAELLKAVDQQVGLKNTLVVLSADHGSPEAPGYMRSLGVDAFYVDPHSWDKAGSIERLKKELGIGSELILEYFHPYVYLNHELIAQKGLNLGDVQDRVAHELKSFKGIAFAVSANRIEQGRLPDTPVGRAVVHNHNPRRSGDVFVVFDPHCFISDFDGLHVACTHGSPWRYDTFVPIIFAGHGLKPQNIYRRVHTVDLALTLSAAVGTDAPSGAAGTLLHEVLTP